jgi:hypothetical protein
MANITARFVQDGLNGSPMRHAMTGRQATLQLRMVGAVLNHERKRGRSPRGLPERARMLIEQAARSLDGSVDGADALAHARRELALSQSRNPAPRRMRSLPTARASG